MSDQTKKRISRKSWITLAILVAPILFFILNCSGILFPVIASQQSLAGGIERDFGIKIPASLKVIHAGRVAYRDPAYYYACDISAADIPEMIAALSRAAINKTYQLQDAQFEKRFSTFGGGEPDWYTPGKYADITRLEILLPSTASSSSSDSGYWFFFSPSAQKLWIFWFST